MLWFDYRFGLFVMSPILLIAVPAAFLKNHLVSFPERMFSLAFFLGFSLFFSCVQYTRLEWVTGIRYMVPVVPFLFLLAVGALVRMPRIVSYSLAVLALVQCWSMSMARKGVGVIDESALKSLQSVFLEGFQLPWLNTLSKMGSQYLPSLNGQAVPVLPFFVLSGFIIYGIWIKTPWKVLEERKRTVNLGK